MDIQKALTYITEDEDWISKVAIGSLVTFVPILNLATLGYHLETTRRLARGERRPLPNWSDLGQLWNAGWPLGLASFIYALPLLLVVFTMLGSWIGVAVSFAASDGESLPPQALLFIAVGLGALALNFLFGLLLGLIFPAVTLNHLQHGTLAACFDFRAIFGLIRQNLRAYFILYLWQWVVGFSLTFIIVFVGGIVSLIPCLGQLIYMALLGGSSFFVMLVNANLLAQFQQTLTPPGQGNSVQ